MASGEEVPKITASEIKFRGFVVLEVELLGRRSSGLLGVLDLFLGCDVLLDVLEKSGISLRLAVELL